MKRLLLTLLLWPAFAWSAVTWTCTTAHEDITSGGGGFYVRSGKCASTAGSTYTTGGDALGVSASVADTGVALCGSNNRILRHLIVTSVAQTNGGVVAAVAVFDHTTNKLQLFGQTPTSATANTIKLDELTSATTVPSMELRFLSLCQ